MQKQSIVLFMVVVGLFPSTILLAGETAHWGGMQVIADRNTGERLIQHIPPVLRVKTNLRLI